MASRRMIKKMMENNRSASFALQLTAMVDMFTILLVFLLRSYSTSAVQINPADGLILPTSQSHTNPVEALLLVVSPKGIYVGEQRVVALTEGKLDGQNVDVNDPKFIKPLYDELNKQAEKTRQIAAANETVEFDGKVILQADQSLSYDLLRKVMYTATLAGYANLKLATMSGD